MTAAWQASDDSSDAESLEELERQALEQEREIEREDWLRGLAEPRVDFPVTVLRQGEWPA